MPITPLTPFGNWIEAHQSGMTETELASKIGLSRTQVWKIKTGQTGLKKTTVNAIAAAVQGNAEEALRLAFVDKPSSNSVVDILIQAIKFEVEGMTEEQARKLAPHIASNIRTLKQVAA